MSRTQQLSNQQNRIYDERPVVIGPHRWEIDGYQFETVLVRCNDDLKEPRMHSVVDCRSGKRLGRVEVPAPKSRPNNALTIVSRLLDALQTQFGVKACADRIRSAIALKEQDRI